MSVRLSILAFSLLTAVVAVGQPRPVSATLPAYRQIKPASHEIYDYVPPRGTVSQSLLQTFRLSDYPAEKTTYIINGKIVSKTSEVRAKVAEPGMHIDSLSIGPPDTDGKRLIRIRLLPNQP